MKFFFNRRTVTQDLAEKVVIGDTLETATAADTETEIAAVIALALNMYVEELRNYENAVVTIQKVIRPYSPWSSKIYGLRQQPMFIPGLRSRIK